MRIAGRCIRTLVVFAAVLLAGAGGRPAVAAQYAAIVMDMRDGTVLYQSHADRRQSPASLTKMMTLYLAFEAVQNGQLGIDQRVRISRHAARQPASKLYLKAGQRVSIRSLIRASAIKSANDAAVALAEAISGSEKAFARLMTARARQLGMTNTTFRNATGLTARGHLSTARDMAILGRHLFFDFPQYYNLFSRKTTHAAGRRISAHNRLLISYRGADGLKTGYTRAAGYTLVASARRGGKRIIAALLGGKSSRWRYARMANLLDKGFARAATRVALVPPQARQLAVARAPLPPAKPGAPATGIEVLARMLGSRAMAATPPSNSRLAPLYAVVPPGRPAPPGRDATGPETGPEAGPATVNNAAPMPVPPPRPGRVVQLGESENRRIEFARVSEIAPGDVGTLASAAPVIDQSRSRKGAAFYRAPLPGMAPSAACRTLEAGGGACVTLAQVPPL